MKNINTIFFDWGGVLIDSPDEKFFKYLSDYFKLPEKEVEWALRKIWNKISKGKMDNKKIFEELEQKSSTSASQDLWYEAMKYAINNRREMFDLIEILKSRNFKIGIISDTEPGTAKYFREKYNQNLFEKTIFSCEVGVVKPNPEIYKIALNKINSRAKESLFIDDKEKNISGAMKVGMNGILFNSYKQLIKDLNNILNINL
jgi:putative hydrolase of the HAD superfamily